MNVTKDNPLKDKSFDSALRIIKLFKILKEKRKDFILSKQLLRSGTSIGANIREAQNAQSSADFIHKLAIAQKECDETIYWLELLHQSDFLDEKEFQSIVNDANQILKMLKSSIITTKKRIHNL